MNCGIIFSQLLEMLCFLFKLQLIAQLQELYIETGKRMLEKKEYQKNLEVVYILKIELKLIEQRNWSSHLILVSAHSVQFSVSFFFLHYFSFTLLLVISQMRAFFCYCLPAFLYPWDVISYLLTTAKALMFQTAHPVLVWYTSLSFPQKTCQKTTYTIEVIIDI